VEDANLVHTPILDYLHRDVQAVMTHVEQSWPNLRAALQAVHRHIADVMRPVNSIEEDIPVSRLLRIHQGSCSQRMGCVEALARAFGIPTRVRALWLDRSFWYARLPLLRPVLPKRTLMPWPQFWLDGAWVDFDEVYDSTARLAAHASHPFTNRGESLFDAIRHVPVDFLGKSEKSGCPAFSLARFVVGQDGFFDTRDQLLRELDSRSWFSRLSFRLTYQDKPVRRLPD